MCSFEATPFVRSSFNCSVTYCSGFCFVANVAVSDMLLLLMVGIGRGESLLCSKPRASGKPLNYFSGVHQFGIMLSKYRFQCRRRALVHCMNVLNQLVDVRGHDEQISRWSGTRIPIGVRSFPWHKHTGAGLRLNYLLTHLDAHSAFQYVPRLIVSVVHMRRSNQPPLAHGTTGIPPFRNHKTIRAGAERVSRK